MGGAPLWLAPHPLLLASTSPTRRELLERAGIPVETEAPSVDERALQTALGDASGKAVATCLADAKALAISERRPDRLVVGADQILDCDGTLFAKAANRDEAAATLAALSGRSHTLVSVLTVARGRHVAKRAVATAHLTMRPLEPTTIARYLAAAGDAATRSVGCYEVEGLGIQLFSRIEGEHSAILGLPLLPLLAILRRMGALAP